MNPCVCKNNNTAVSHFSVCLLANRSSSLFSRDWTLDSRLKGLVGLLKPSAFSPRTAHRFPCFLPWAAAAGNGKVGGGGCIYFSLAVNNSLCCWSSSLHLSTCCFSGAQQHGAGAHWWLHCYPSQSERIHLTVIVVVPEAPLKAAGKEIAKISGGGRWLSPSTNNLWSLLNVAVWADVSSQINRRESPLNPDLLCEWEGSKQMPNCKI